MKKMRFIATTNHKTLKCFGGDDRYENLVIVHCDVHVLIHAKSQETIEKYMSGYKEQLKKLNKLRVLARLPEIVQA